MRPRSTTDSAGPDAPRRATAILEGRTSLGIELGSTRIKACLVGEDPTEVLAVGSHEWENRFVDRVWTYSLEDVWSGLQAAYADLVADVRRRYDVEPQTFGAIGVSAMMHGYLAFDADDELLVPFRTWRNTSTGPAAAELSEQFGLNIPLRWSIAHLYQAVLDEEPHVPQIAFLTTLAGYVHWRLTGRKAIGVGDASGMFPIDSATSDYDARLLAVFDGLVADRAPGLHLADLLPEVLPAGREAGELTAEGAALLDPSGALQPGVAFCPPEGDAGTGMVATNSVAPRTGNVSAGTSIFAMVVLERPLEHAHHELDLVTTPAGDPVAMVHCNNGASELAAWVGVFARFATVAGVPVDTDAAFEALFREALEGEADAGGLLAYNHLAGEPIAGLAEGRPMVVRTPDSRLTLANFMRAQLYGVYGTLSARHAGARRRGRRTRPDVRARRHLPHRRRRPAPAGRRPRRAGRRRRDGVGGRRMGHRRAGVVPVRRRRGRPRRRTSSERVFANAEFDTVDPVPEDVAGFSAFLDRYRAGLAAEAAAVDAL